MKNPIKFKTDYDPQSDLEKILLQQIDEMDREEFQRDMNIGTYQSTASVVQNGRHSEAVLDTLGNQQTPKNGSQDLPTQLIVDDNQKSRSRPEFKLFTSKLAKFKNTKLKILCFGPAN